MPSIISRIRRASENGSRPETEEARPKRLSIDVSQVDHQQDSPKSGKLKGLFGKHDGTDGSHTKMDTLRKKINTPSTIFKSAAPEPDRPITPPADENDPALARYSAAAPLTPSRSSNNNGSPRFPSPTTSPQQFALSRSRSPENGAHRNSWTPSYPLVVPDDGYADIPPDGHASVPLNLTPLKTGTNENSLRRSMQLDRPPTLDDIEPIQPDQPKSKPAIVKISPDSGLPTPPTSTDSQDDPIVSRPSLSLETDLDRPSAHIEQPSTSSTSSEPTPVPGPQSPTPISPTLATPQSPSPATADSARPPRPVRQRTNLITSPPMPQPIKNLPTLVGWSGFNQASSSPSPVTPRTPGWGSLAREGGPKTPGGLLSPRTPGGGSSFPFNAIPLPRQTSKGPMSEVELRKAKRAMPVMLREPSFKPSTQDDGEVGASDDDDEEESDTEVEGGVGGDQDHSEDETETERAKNKGKKKAVPLRQRLKGKNKGKTASSPGVGITAVSEEADSPPATSSGATTSAANASTGNSSTWSLPTPKEKHNPIWAQFRAGTPGTAASQRPDDPTRSSSYQTSNGSYFDSQPGSSVNVTTASLPIEAQAQKLDVNAPVDPASVVHPPQSVQENENDDDVDDDGAAGSDEEDDTSSQDHSSMTHTSPQQVSPTILPDARPNMTKRPSIYTQISQSMINLGSNTATDASGSNTDKVSARPNLETIRSREGAPTKIDLPKPRTPGSAAPIFTPGSEWAKPPPTPAAGFAGMFFGRKDGEKPALKRRRSAGDLEAPPPGYEPPHPGVMIPRPRDEEGREKLPEYWCAVHIEGNLSRKMEFSAPGVQSRDRSWKKHYFIVRGTALFVYKFDPHRFPLKTDKPIVPTTTEEECEEHLHVHMPGERRASLTSPINGAAAAPRRASLENSSSNPASAANGSRRGSISTAFNNIASDGRRGSLPGPSPLSAGADHARRASNATATPTTSTASGPDAKDTALFNSAPRKPSVSSSINSASSQSTSIASHFQQNQLVKVYTLQNAESGLAADYVKRKNVVRVRSEGEQFLLQTDSARDVVDWIEAFQSATNVALDLDDRPMPKIITLPRRRRRRVPGAAGAAAGTSATAADAAGPAQADTPEGNAAAVAAAEAATRERERMLAEDQSGSADRS